MKCNRCQNEMIPIASRRDDTLVYNCPICDNIQEGAR